MYYVFNASGTCYKLLLQGSGGFISISGTNFRYQSAAGITMRFAFIQLS
jgi:hypothetical protein